MSSESMEVPNFDEEQYFKEEELEKKVATNEFLKTCYSGEAAKQREPNKTKILDFSYVREQKEQAEFNARISHQDKSLMEDKYATAIN